MNNSALAMQEQVTTAQNELDLLLADGGDTFTARQKLKDAQSQLSMIEQEQHEAVSDSAAERSADLQRDASRVVRATIDELSASLAAHSCPTVPVANLPVHLAENILLAREALAGAQERKHASRTQVDHLRQRQNALKTKREQLIQRRAAGNGDDEADAAALALIDADTEGLAKLIDQAACSGPEISTEQEELALSYAQGALATALNFERIRVLKNHVLNLEQALVAAAQALAAAPGVRIPDRYQPCHILKQATQTGVL